MYLNYKFKVFTLQKRKTRPPEIDFFLIRISHPTFHAILFVFHILPSILFYNFASHLSISYSFSFCGDFSQLSLFKVSIHLNFISIKVIKNYKNFRFYNFRISTYINLCSSLGLLQINVDTRLNEGLRVTLAVNLVHKKLKVFIRISAKIPFG